MKPTFRMTQVPTLVPRYESTTEILDVHVDGQCVSSYLIESGKDFTLPPRWSTSLVAYRTITFSLRDRRTRLQKFFGRLSRKVPT